MGTKSTTTPFSDVSHRLADLKGTVGRGARDAAHRVGNGISTVGDQMQSRPLVALGIALGIGYLLGRLMAR